MTSSIIGIALSGLNAAQTRVQNSANNVANVNTVQNDQAGIDAFRATEVQQTSLASGGVQTTIRESEAAIVDISDGNGGVIQAPNVDLAEEVINQQIATYTFEANLRVIQTADELAEELTDILA